MLPVPSWGAAGQARKVSTEMVVWGRGVTHPRASLLSVSPPSCPRSRDFYHTCYCLSGLAIAQHFGSGDLHHELVLGIPENRLVGWGGGGRRSGTPTSGLFQAQSALSFTLAAAHASSLQHCAGKSGEGGDALLAAACAQPGGCRVGV